MAKIGNPNKRSSQDLFEQVGAQDPSVGPLSKFATNLVAESSQDIKRAETIKNLRDEIDDLTNQIQQLGLLKMAPQYASKESQAAILQETDTLADRMQNRQNRLISHELEASKSDMARRGSAFRSLAKSIGASVSNRQLASARQDLIQTPEFVSGVSQMAGQFTATEMQQRVAATQEEIQQQRLRMEAAPNLRRSDESVRAEIAGRGAHIGRLNVRLAQEKAALEQLGQEDPIRLQGRIANAGQRLTERSFREGLAQQGAAGQLDPRDTLKQREEAEKRLIDAMKALENATKNGTAATKDQIQRFDKAEKEERQAAQTHEAAVRSGGGGLRGRVAAQFGTAAYAARLGSEVGQALGIDQQMANMANRAGFAAIANAEYDDQMRAAQGDTGAMLRRIHSARQAAGRYGDQMYGRQQGVGVLRGAAYGLEAAQEGLEAFSNAGILTGVKDYLGFASVNTQVGKAAGAAAAGTVQGFDVMHGITAGQTSLRAQRLFMNTFDTVMYQRASNLSEFRQQVQGAAESTRELGGARGRIVDDITGATFIGAMGAAGVTRDRQMNLTAMAGRVGLGNQFDPTQNLLQLRGMEVSGLGRMEQNVSRAGELVGAGANNAFGSLQMILEQAVAKGMDSSRAIDIMTRGISNMSRRSAAAAGGVDITGALARAIAGMSDPGISNDLMRADVAQRTLQTAGGILSNTNVSYSEMMRQSAFANILGSTGAATAFAGVDIGTRTQLYSATSGRGILPTGSGRLGFVSEEFESAGGANQIGYDPAGGTSFGRYQIASRTGDMNRFVNTYLSKFDPKAAAIMRAAGPFNTGGRGGRASEAWGSIQDREAVQAAQHAYIKETKYDPLLKEAKALNYDVDDRRVQEMLWSMSVQHGGARKILRRTAQNVGGLGFESTEQMITATMQERGRYVSGLTHLSSDIRRNALRRFGRETQKLLSVNPNEKVDTAEVDLEKAARIASSIGMGGALGVTAEKVDGRVRYGFADPQKAMKQIRALQDAEMQKLLIGQEGTGLAFGIDTSAAGLERIREAMANKADTGKSTPELDRVLQSIQIQLKGTGQTAETYLRGILKMGGEGASPEAVRTELGKLRSQNVSDVEAISTKEAAIQADRAVIAVGSLESVGEKTGEGGSAIEILRKWSDINAAQGPASFQDAANEMAGNLSASTESLTLAAGEFATAANRLVENGIKLDTSALVFPDMTNLPGKIGEAVKAALIGHKTDTGDRAWRPTNRGFTTTPGMSMERYKKHPLANP